MEAQKSPKVEAGDKSRSGDERVEPARDHRERSINEAAADQKHDDQRHDERKKHEEPKSAAKESRARAAKTKNNVRKFRTERMMSKAELARRANLSTLTVDRVERGMPCRMDTKRKILEALGLKPSDRVTVFGDAPDDVEDQD